MDLSVLQNLLGWIPFRIEWYNNTPQVNWCYMGERTFREPFFEHTIRAITRDPQRLQMHQHTGIEVLGALRRARPGLPLGGLIFHMSRCGSTVPARLLATCPEYVMLSEAPPIDEILDGGRRSIPDDVRVQWLRDIVAALAQPRTGSEQRAYIKLDSWHILDLPLIRRAFPDVPWLFLYRDPIEVMVSHQRLRGMQMAPGQIAPQRLGLEPSAVIPPFSLEQFCARVLGNYCAAAAQYAPSYNGLLLNYNQFPEAIWSTLLPHLGVHPTAEQRELMELELLYHAKQPGQPFEHDSQAKRQAASAEIRGYAEQYVYPAYQRLEDLRH